MRFTATVEGARWDEDAQMWRVALADGETLTTRYLITATGFLSQPRCPTSRASRPSTGGSSTPPTGTTPTTRPVSGSAIIGTGATAVQLIPELAKKAADLTVYQRTPIWVVPKIDFRIAERAKRLFARVPLTQRVVRAITDTIYE